MTGVITTGSFPKALVQGVNKWTHASYNEHPMECVQVFGEMETSRRKYEETVEVTGFPMASEKAEGSSVLYFGHNQGPTTRFTHVAYGAGFIVTREEGDDNLYPELARSRSMKLGRSFRIAKETVGGNILNRAFTAAYAGGDGKELCATDHPVAAGGTFSNELSPAADLTEASLEDLMTQIEQAKDNANMVIAIKPQMLVVPPALTFEAERIITSTLRPGTANNDRNVLNGKLPKGSMTYHFLDDEDAWFITTDCPDGLKGFQRTRFEVSRDNDFDTMNAKFKGYERYVFGWSDPRGIYGSTGS